MNKKVIGVGVVAVIIIGAVSFLILGMPKATTKIGTEGEVSVGAPVDIIAGAKNATYKINGMSVTLKDGVSEIEAAPGAASKIITRYFGNGVRHDFDGDGREDMVFLVSQETGGSGIFYYVVAVLNKATGAVGSQDAVLLGDRIAPQSTNMGKGNIVVVNYADRQRSEPFTTQPSQGKSMWLLLDTTTLQFGIVEPDFTGEADPARMSLGMKKWNWMGTTYSNGTEVKPADPARFVVTFAPQSFSATTDCNSVGGPYTTKGDTITFGEGMISTMMACMDSKEGEFTGALRGATKYRFTGKGELLIDTLVQGGKGGATITGTMTFK